MFTSIKQYSDSIERFRPKYDEETCKRMGRAEGLIVSIMSSIHTQMMMLDMLKANIFYNKPVHECIDFKMPDAQYVSATTPNKAMFWHGLLGILTECYEVYIELQTKGMSKINGVGEIGDLGWFLNELAISFRTSLLQAFNVNEAKLDARFGESFTTGKAITRNKLKEELRMSIALEEAKKLEAGGESDKDARINLAELHEEHQLLAACLPALEDAARHNASNSQRITAARIREILGLEPYHYRHGKNFNGKGEEVNGSWDVGSQPSDPDAGSVADSGGRPAESQSEQLPE